jgi:hypothetical protein
MLSKDSMAAFFVSFISLGLGIALLQFTPSLFTYVLSAFLFAISFIIIVLKYKNSCTRDISEPTLSVV